VNYSRIALASLGAVVAYVVYGFVMFGAWPSMKTEFMKYPNVYRPKDELMKVMPYGMVAILVAIVVVAILYAKIYTAVGGIVSGIYLGFLCLHVRDPQLCEPEHQPYVDDLPVHCVLHSVDHCGRNGRADLQTIVDSG
jgi:hypothetical protein